LNIDAVELRRVVLPLISPFRTSFGTQTQRDVLLVRVIADAAEGWAECVAIAAPLYSSEYTDAAHRVITDHLLPRLLAADRLSADLVAPLLRPVRGHQMAKAAPETAVLDAQLKATACRSAVIRG
jgi:O-succinylbenzoate synthase